MSIILNGRVMSVGLKDATPETKDRAAKESVVEVEIYVARQRMEIVQAPAHMLGPLEDLEGEEVVIECGSYTPWSIGNKVGISFKFGSLLDENFKPVVPGAKKLPAQQVSSSGAANGQRPLSPV